MYCINATPLEHVFPYATSIPHLSRALAGFGSLVNFRFPNEQAPIKTSFSLPSTNTYGVSLKIPRFRHDYSIAPKSP